jgi:hypothetical protein
LHGRNVDRRPSSKIPVARRSLLGCASVVLVLGALACNARIERAASDGGTCPPAAADATTTDPPDTMRAPEDGGRTDASPADVGIDVGPSFDGSPYDTSWDVGSRDGGVACRPAPDPGGACGSGTCVAAARTHVPHLAPFIAKLKDGRVMVLGGDGYSRVAEIYTPSCDRWDLVALGPLGFYRWEGSYGTGATMSLDDGRLLVVSGRYDTSGVAYSIYAPATDTWTPAQSLEGFYTAGHAAPLPGKRFMLVGTPKTANGCGAAIYDEATSTFSAVTKVGAELSECHPLGLAALHDGRVIMASYEIGIADGSVYTRPHVFLYAPATDAWSEIATPSFAATGYDALVTLTSGDVLMATFHGGQRLDAATLTWTEVTAVSGGFGTVTALPCDAAMSIGDYDTKPRGWNAVWSGTTNTLTTFGMRRPRMAHGSVLLDDGRVLVVGGGVTQGHGILTSEVCR